MIKYGDIIEIGMQARKIEDLSTLKVVAEHIQLRNYGSSSERNSKKKEDDVSLMLQGQNGRGSNNVSSIRAQGNNLPHPQLVFNQNNDGRRLERVRNRNAHLRSSHL